LTSENSGINSLAGVDVHQLSLTQAESREGLFDLVDLSLANSLNLSFTNTIPVEDNLSRVGSIGSLEGITS
jgi:hypothetical protein